MSCLMIGTCATEAAEFDDKRAFNPDVTFAILWLKWAGEFV